MRLRLGVFDFQLTKEGVKGYFRSGWNMIDATMYVLMILAYIIWIVVYFTQIENEATLR